MDEEEAPPGVLEFGDEEEPPAAAGGRRAKAQRASRSKQKAGSFEALGLCNEVVRGIRRKGYRLPTPIQRRALPPALGGQDVVGMARTGSGKTAAFVIPILQRLQAHSKRTGARAVVLAPTRELALQTHKVFQELGRYMDLRMAVLVGGDSLDAQFAELATNPDIIVATPGRLAHHLEEVEAFSLRSVQVCVFDEADRLFEMGFAEQLRTILGQLSEGRQTLLFSATLPAALAEFARAGLHQPEFVRLDADAKLSPDLRLCFATIRQEEKLAGLLVLLREVLPAGAPTLVFAATRHHVELIQRLLQLDGVAAACVYGQMDQAARKVAVGKFRAGRLAVLVVTDVAARGLDIPLLDNVIHFDFPAKPKLFVHRAGRAARAGRSGAAYSLVTRGDLPHLLDLHLFLARGLQPSPPGVSVAEAARLPPPPDTTVYGSFPPAALEEAGERVRELLAAHGDLRSLQRSCANAWTLYWRTRPAASPESASRARSLPQEGLQPELAAACRQAAVPEFEGPAAQLTQRLHAFRPSSTVLEDMGSSGKGFAVGQGHKGKQGPGAVQGQAGGGLLDIMRQKRAVHGKSIQANAEQRQSQLRGEPAAAREEAAAGEEADGPGPSRPSHAQASSTPHPLGLGDEDARFRDDSFYLPARKADQCQEAGFSVHDGAGEKLSAAVLDLQADDEAGLAAAKRRFHWDAPKRAYVQLQPGETVKAGKRQRLEGNKPKKGRDEKGMQYQRWAQQSKLQVAPVGEAELAGAAKLGSLAGRFKKGGRGWANPLKADAETARPRPELRSREEVLKGRKEATKKRLGKGPGPRQSGGPRQKGAPKQSRAKRRS